MNRATFFDNIRPFFGKLSQAQVLGMEGIIDAFEEVGDGKPETLAYALATAYHETGRRMVPVREGFAVNDPRRGLRSPNSRLNAGRTVLLPNMPDRRHRMDTSITVAGMCS